MNEKEFNRLQRELEDATSDEPLDPRWTDNDITSLREGWQVLDQVLAPLEAQCPPVERLVPPELREVRPVTVRPAWRKLATPLAAVAASLLVGLLATWMIIHSFSSPGAPGSHEIVRENGDSDQPEEKDDNLLPEEQSLTPEEEKPRLVDDRTPTPDVETPGPAAPENDPRNVQLAETMPDWDDPLDSEITSTMTTMQMLNQRLNSSAVSYESVWYQMDSLQEELDDGTL